MKPKLTLTLILFLTLNACEKNDSPTFFQGIVTEHNTDVPLPNVLIKLNRNDAYTGLAPNFFANVVIDTTRTDNNGFYKFSFDQDDKLLYRVSAFLPNYIKVENWMTPEPIATFIQKMSVNSDTFVLGKSATLKLNLSNTTHNFDRISLSCRSYLSDSTNLYI
ncbi:MAG: hypothetical protein K8F24_13545, partial [Bacteroidales bacterium]|nr:hypothetical protein [Bacteroidales bacterium]